jgi:hypothetical protein
MIPIIQLLSLRNTQQARLKGINLDTITSISESTAGNPVINVGVASSSDEKIREIGNVIYRPNETTHKYVMWYTGYSVYGDASLGEKIHVAYSSDGLNWTKSASNPVISNRYEDPHCYFDGTTFYLFVEDKENGYVQGWGDSREIKLFTATNPEGPYSDQGIILAPSGTGSGQGDSHAVASPVIFKNESTFYLIYEGGRDYGFGDAPIMMAESSTIDGTYSSRQIIYDDNVTLWSAGTSYVPDDAFYHTDDKVWYISHHSRRTDGDFSEGIFKSSDLSIFVDNTSANYFTGEAPTDAGPPPSQYVGQVKTASIYLINNHISMLYYGGDTQGIYLARESS